MTTINQNSDNPNRNTVCTALGYNEWGYENLIHKHFVTWCEEMALRFFHSDRDLIQNERLYKYYQRQWSILVESQMMADYGEYLKKAIPETKEFYYNILCEYANDLENFYPASLLKPNTAKQLKEKYQFNYN